ncbi:MAG: SDR family oxidoreductase [Alphaproteobacteria bacterium]|nr:SDR family oxidoreductase [Alphaproteobacteria bacterium]
MPRRKHGPTVLITGANRGLGLEFARQFAVDGWRVIATCRQPKAAKSLSAIKGDVRVRALDVTDPVQVRALARALKSETIDLLINNAGIYGPRKETFGQVDLDAWHRVFETNVMGPMMISEALADHVARSERKTIIALTSLMGSIAETQSGGGYIYRSSKAALNMVMKGLTYTLKPRKISVVMLHPGWVRTDMGGASAHLGIEESVTAMRRVIAGLKPADNGRFFNYDGRAIPW